MKTATKSVKFFLAAAVLSLVLPLLLGGCSHPFPYQGTFNGNWSGSLTILSRTIPVGGTISVNVDSKGTGSGTVSSSSGGASPATMNATVDENGNLTGTVSFTLSGTNFISNWQGKIDKSGNLLNLQGTWTSQHGSGTFSGTGTKTK